jgi:hypothetical protein
VSLEVHVLDEYIFAIEDDVGCIFIFQTGGVFSVFEVDRLASNSRLSHSRPEQLRSFGSTSGAVENKSPG